MTAITCFSAFMCLIIGMLITLVILNKTGILNMETDLNPTGKRLSDWGSS